MFERFGVEVEVNLEMAGRETLLYQLVFYVPVNHCEAVKDAIFAAGAGRLGDYERCAWQVCGQGQFRPVGGATPFLGEVGVEERLEEIRVECVIQSTLVRDVLEALIAAHPFEEPAYGVWPLMTVSEFPGVSSVDA